MKKKGKNLYKLNEIQVNISQLKEFTHVLIECCYISDVESLEFAQLKSNYSLAQKLTYELFDMLLNEEGKLQSYVESMK